MQEHVTGNVMNWNITWQSQNLVHVLIVRSPSLYSRKAWLTSFNRYVTSADKTYYPRSYTVGAGEYPMPLLDPYPYLYVGWYRILIGTHTSKNRHVINVLHYSWKTLWKITPDWHPCICGLAQNWRMRSELTMLTLWCVDSYVCVFWVMRDIS